MSRLQEPLGDRLYQALLRLLPFDFRSEFGGDMEETFRMQRSETQRERGSVALLKMWWATITDIVRMAPREHCSVLSQDLRYALRMMRKNFAYTSAAVLILGLGIGANTAIFSVVNSVLLKPLPYLQGDRLVVLRQQAAKLGIEDAQFSVKEIADYRQQNRSLAGLVEYHSMTFTLFGPAEAHRVRTGVVSPEFFDFFGVRPMLGRTFVADDDRPGAPPVLVLSYEFWKQGEGGDPHILGKTYQMNDRPHTVIGVLPPIPQYPDENDVYMPTSACPFRASPDMMSMRDHRMMSVFGRLKPHATMDHCRSDMSVIARRLEQDYPEFYPKNAGFQATASPLREDLTGHARPMLLALLGAAAFVLLIACANVANLILARMARRERELIIRTAIGAGSGRLLRQLLTESLILALLAAAFGLLFAAGSLRLLTEFAGQFTPRAREISLDGRVLAFAILCACATTIVFGSVAALYSRQEVSSGLQEGSRAGAERSRKFVRGALIAAQVAFSYVLLAGAGLMVRSFIQLNRVEPGFVPQRVFAVGIDLNWSKYRTAQQQLPVAKQILERLETQPGVLAAAISSSFPLNPDNAGSTGLPARFRVERDPRPESESPPVTSMRSGSPGYFKTLGIPLLAGRTFLETDDAKAPLVNIINRNLARRRWGSQDPIGKRISFDEGRTWTKIVGVVGDVKEFGLDRDTPYQVYMPLAQNSSVGSVLVRTVGDPVAVAGRVRRAILDVDPQIAIPRFETLEQAREDSVASPRTLARLFGLFAALALLIAVAGIASMLALWVRQRMREIGIRMALGASPRDVLRSVIRRGMALVVVGLALGFGGALVATDLLKALLFQVAPTDVPTYLLVSALLLGAALVACYLPARRAARIDPQVALRCD